jgi:hypothetical protein
MGRIFWILPFMIFLSCNESNNTKKTEEKLKTEKIDSKPKIDFNPTKISHFTIEESEFSRSKALTRKLSDYSTQELRELTEFLNINMSIVVPFDISKESLEHTLKSIVYDKTRENEDIDEIIIFAYDDKNDIGNGYTFGKLLWAPNGKTGNVTPDIAKNNNRTNYRFDITIKEKVGNINKSDVPTKRELEIYSEIVNENGQYTGKDDDEIKKIVMKKYKIDTEEEYEKIYLKVGVYKIF